MDSVSRAQPSTPLERVGEQVREARYRIVRQGTAALLAPSVVLWHRALYPEKVRPPKAAQVSLEKRIKALMKQDLANVREGIYGEDVLFDFPTGDFIRHLPKVPLELRRILKRRRNGDFDELPDSIDLSAFPPYYRRTFHWQSDGWLSHRSADIYEVGVEFLFLGFAQAMRRMALPPLVKALHGQRAPRVLDLACGAGTFTTLLRRCLPTAHLYGVDLSPFYLDRAASRLPSWPPFSAVAENAEDLSFKGDSFDAISCVFLFHELPKPARRRVIHEAYRVLKPGGTFVISDSAQLNDSPEMAQPLEGFPKTYHEPYFKSYLRDPLEDIVKESGFTLASSKSWLLSKVIVATKPLN